jgi:two-component system, chemotaxis family, CheB/CheR fusion protein
LAATRPDEEFRVWVAGCATGEEAYSLAILLMERMEAMHRPVKVKIFATDVHRASLEFASSGVYSGAALADGRRCYIICVTHPIRSDFWIRLMM